jgi:hypothetical protein
MFSPFLAAQAVSLIEQQHGAADNVYYATLAHYICSTVLLISVCVEIL